MGLIIGSILVFTDNFGRFLDYLQNALHGLLKRRSESKETRKAHRLERAELKRRAKEEAILVKAQAKAERQAAKEEQVAIKLKEAEIKSEEDRPLSQERKPSLLSGIGLESPPPEKSNTSSKLKNVPVPISEPTQKKPALTRARVKIISGERTEKATASIPERRGDYVFPPVDLLAEANELLIGRG